MTHGIAFPVLLVLSILSASAKPTHATEVVVFDQTGEEVNVGDVMVEELTVGELKELVAMELEIRLDTVRLATIRGAPLLENHKQLSDYVYAYEHELVVKICDDLTKPGPIHIDMGDHKLEMVVRKNKTLGWLKKEVLLDLDMNVYRVFHQGMELTDDSKTLGELQFYRGAYIVMLREDQSFKITVFPLEGEEGKTFNVTLKTNLTELKKMIKDSGLGTDEQLLLHDGKLLHENRKLFSHTIHPIYFGFVVHLVNRISETGDKIMLFWKKLEGISYLSVFVNSTNTLEELKEFAFEADSSIPIDKMELRFADLLLSGDSRKLGEFHLYPGAYIQVSKQS